MTEKPEHPASTAVPVAETTEEISDVISQLETHKKTVIVAILGTTIILSAVIIFRGLTSEKHLAAAEAYSQAASSRTVENLDQVIADYPQSVAAGNALLTKAELQLTSGKSEDARIALLAFIEKYNSHPRYSQGLFAMGNLYQVADDNDNAAKYYAQILKEDPKSDLAPFAMIRQGDLLLAAGKKDEARQKYESIMPAYRGTSFFLKIEEKIKLLEVEKLPLVKEPKKPTPAPISKTAIKPAAKAAAKVNPKPGPKPAKPAPKADAPPAAKKAAAKPDTSAKKPVQSPPPTPSAKKKEKAPAKPAAPAAAKKTAAKPDTSAKKPVQSPPPTPSAKKKEKAPAKPAAPAAEKKSTSTEPKK